MRDFVQIPYVTLHQIREALCNIVLASETNEANGLKVRSEVRIINSLLSQTVKEPPRVV